MSLYVAYSGFFYFITYFYIFQDKYNFFKYINFFTLSANKQDIPHHLRSIIFTANFNVLVNEYGILVTFQLKFANSIAYYNFII